MSVPVKPTSSQYKLDVKRPSLLTLIVLISFGSIGAALFTPAIPAIIDFFNVSVSFAQFTVTIYLIGYSIGQLFYSPLAKRFGRKPALYMGISIAVMGTVLCVLARPFYSFNLLLIGRFVMSLGASVGLSLTFLIISDYFYEKHARKITAYTMLAFAVVPGVSIAVGGVLVSFFKWDSCFYFLILYAAFALYLVYRLDETGPGREKSATKIKAVIKNYRRDFKNPILLTYSIIIGSTTAIVYGFAATAPVIVIREMGVRPDMFGFFNLIPASGYFLGNFLAARLATYFEIKTVLRLGIGLMGIGTVVLFSLFWMGIFGLLALFLPAGGHVEPDEHPTKTAHRELKEELGVDLSLLNPDPLFVTVTKTAGTTVGHTDVSLWYVFGADCRDTYMYDEREFNDIRWFSLSDLPLEKSDPHMSRFRDKLKLRF